MDHIVVKNLSYKGKVHNYLVLLIKRKLRTQVKPEIGKAHSNGRERDDALHQCMSNFFCHVPEKHLSKKLCRCYL